MNSAAEMKSNPYLPASQDSMEKLKLQFEAGDWRALSRAVKSLTGGALPPWLKRALHDCIRAKYEDGNARRSDKRYVADIARAVAVHRLRRRGMTWEDACKKAAADLRGKIAGSDATMRTAYAKHRGMVEFWETLRTG